MLRALLAATGLLLSMAGMADGYVWLDARGAPKFADAPPAEGAREITRLGASFRFFTTPATDPFRSGAGDGVSDDGVWWVEQKAGTRRAAVVAAGPDRRSALRLHTEPGDHHVSSSGDHERNDVALPQKATGCYEGREQWWEHSILFPDDYVAPSASAKYSFGWNVVFDFHNSAPGPWQANFHTEVVTLSPDPDRPLSNPYPPMLRFRGHGGEKSGDGAFIAPIGPVVRNVWYDFVYHVRWSSGPGGHFDAWVNGVKKLSHSGPTLYSGQGCYLKLANYHVAYRQASSVLHARVIRHDVDAP